MILYDGRKNSCFIDRQRGSEKYPDGCREPCVVRREGKYLVVHLCDDHRDLLADVAPHVAELTGSDELPASPMSRDDLFRSAANVYEVDGVTRADWEEADERNLHTEDRNG